MRNPHSLELRKNQVMGQDRTSIIADDSELRDHIDAFSNQLCQAVDGQFDFTVQVDTDDETLQKLQMLTNFLLDSARRAVGALKQNTRELEAEIAERKKAEEERETLHHELLVTSRLAGMAEVATGVLHNVGNVLNSVNVSATLVSNRFRDSKFSGLVKATAMLEEHADVLQAAVIGVPDELRGEVPIAFVTCIEGARSTEESLRDFARQSLARFKVPRHVHIRDDLPTGPTGKILKRHLCKLL